MTKTYYFTREKITNILQNSGLNIGAIYYILKDILREVEVQYMAQINNELAQEAEENAKTENEKSQKVENETLKDDK